MIRRPPRSTQGVSSAASDVYKRQARTPIRRAADSSHPNEIPEWQFAGRTARCSIWCSLGGVAAATQEQCQSLCGNQPLYAIEQTQLLGRHRVDDVISTQVDWTPRRPPVPITASGIPSGSPINDDNAGTVWKGVVGEGQCENRGSRLLHTGRTSTPSTRLRVIASARWRRGRRQYPPDRQQSRSRCSSTRFIWIT